MSPLLADRVISLRAATTLLAAKLTSAVALAYWTPTRMTRRGHFVVGCRKRRGHNIGLKMNFLDPTRRRPDVFCST
jgi:hypothetical protein